MIKNERSELAELNLSVGVRVYSEEVPEDVVELFFSSFVKDLNDEEPDLRSSKVAFLALVVFIEIHFKLIPNRVKERVLFWRDRAIATSTIARILTSIIASIIASVAT